MITYDCPLLNDYAGTIPAFGVCKISSVITNAGRSVYRVTRPDTTLDQEYMLNGPMPIPQGKAGSGTLGLGYALCDSAASPAYGQHWGVQTNSFLLKQYRNGFFCLGNNQGSGATQRSIVRPYPLMKLRGTLASSVAQGGSVTVLVYTRDGAAWTSSGFSVTAYDDLLNATETLSSGTVVIIYWYGDRWWIQEARCPD